LDQYVWIQYKYEFSFGLPEAYVCACGKPEIGAILDKFNFGPFLVQDGYEVVCRIVVDDKDLKVKRRAGTEEGFETIVKEFTGTVIDNDNRKRAH
jgi:hypothetical protein